MRSTIIVLLAVALHGTTSASALAQNASQSPAALPYHYGEIADATRWPSSAVGVVTVMLNFGHRRFCTGNLVAPKIVLTAAHCLFVSEQLLKPGIVQFLAGLDRRAPAIALIVAKGFAPSAPWRPELSASDWGLRA